MRYDVQDFGNRVRAAHFSGDYSGVTHAGVLLLRRDGGVSVFLTRRAFDETDAPDVRETWEVPGGGLEDGEDPWVGARREFEEEVGVPFPSGRVLHGWRAGPTGNYQGFVFEPDEFPDGSDIPRSDEVSDVDWFTVEEASNLPLRPEVAALDLADLIERSVSGNEGEMDATQVAAQQVGTAEEYVRVPEDDENEVEPVEVETEPDEIEVPTAPIKVHGVLAPEEAPSGDDRGFAAGAVTRRSPFRLPFMWQKVQLSGHDGAVLIGSMDRLMRKGNLIHWEGELLPGNPDAEEFVAVLAHFGRFGVSVDGDKGSLDENRSEQEGMAWFDAVRAAGLTACSIPAYEEAYVALGPHPDMPEEAGEFDDGETLVAGVSVETFRRGPGWVTDPVPTKRIHDYWTKPGQPGFVKIAWGSPGDFTRCTVLVGEKIAENSPDKLRFIKRICAEWHHDALGYWPGDLDMPGNKTTAEARAERAGKSSIDGVEAAAEAVSQIDRDDIAATEEEGAAWEAVLVSSAAGSPRPPLSYFHRHESTEALSIDEPDENGFRRTYGYAAEWGVCHVGFDGRCVEPPEEATDDFAEFHLGRTKTAEGFIPTGVLTYGVGHRDAETILSESPTQAYYDNINNAWAAVRLGQDDRGIWFSGVVLPKVDEDDLVAIEASGQVSGEWKYGALRACLTVNVPGYPVRRASASYDDNGNVVALAASAFGSVDNGTEGSECNAVPSPRDQMLALAKIDAEVRMDSMRAKWNKEG